MLLGTRRMVQSNQEVTYESLLRLFHGDNGFVQIREMFELEGVELERVHCMILMRAGNQEATINIKVRAIEQIFVLNFVN